MAVEGSVVPVCHQEKCSTRDAPAADDGLCSSSDIATAPHPHVEVTGAGWYDHEFGGNIAKADRDCVSEVILMDSLRSEKAIPAPDIVGGGGSGLGMPDVQWVWTGVQLDDGTELTYARTADSSTRGTIVDKAVVVPASGYEYNTDASLEQVAEWTSLRTFIKYGTRWRLEVPSEGLQLDLSAVVDDQELISIIATPAYWEGQVLVRAPAQLHWPHVSGGVSHLSSLSFSIVLACRICTAEGCGGIIFSIGMPSSIPSRCSSTHLAVNPGAGRRHSTRTADSWLRLCRTILRCAKSRLPLDARWGFKGEHIHVWRPV
eukprot:scaffold53008_cov32-Tisochrysis_lutea.AAC.5